MGTEPRHLDILPANVLDPISAIFSFREVSPMMSFDHFRFAGN